MAFFKYSIVMAVLANAYGALLPGPYASPAPYAVPPPAYAAYAHPHPPPPPPPPVAYHHAPPPPPPSVYHAAPHSAAQVVPIVSQSYDASPDGSYVFQYESGDGSQRQEQGVPKFAQGAPGSEGAGGVAVQGRYAYASPEGPVQVEYIADENGFQPSGSHIHPEILKAVAAQVAYARSEGPVGYHAQPAAYVRAYAPPPPPPPPPAPVAVTYAPYPYKA